MQHMMDDLEDAEGILVQQGEEKEQLFDDIERLKGWFHYLISLFEIWIVVG